MNDHAAPEAEPASSVAALLTLVDNSEPPPQIDEPPEPTALWFWAE